LKPYVSLNTPRIKVAALEIPPEDKNKMNQLKENLKKEQKIGTKTEGLFKRRSLTRK
jgi:hypothetical protein